MKNSTEYVGSDGTEFRVTIPAGKKRRFDAIMKAANEEGTIQAWDARELFSKPENHTTMSLARALRLAGFVLDGPEVRKRGEKSGRSKLTKSQVREIRTFAKLLSALSGSGIGF